MELLETLPAKMPLQGEAVWWWPNPLSGRAFAEKQIIGMVAAMLMRRNLEIANTDWKIPLVSEFDDTKQPPVWRKISKRKQT